MAAKKTSGRGDLELIWGDNLQFLREVAGGRFPLIYIDPPFNTGKRQTRRSLRTIRDEQGDRTGFAGKRYRSEVIGEVGYHDRHDDYLAFLRPRLEEARRVLTPHGSIFVHLDYREVHYVKVMLDEIFGRENFINEIIWSYDYGARSQTRWSPKHDNILWYARNAKDYCFNFDAIDRIPYMAPGLVGPEKAARGKTPTDSWWNTIVSPNGKEKTGYPSQKPIAILSRIVRVHSNPGDEVLDFFAGSGSFGAAALQEGRRAILVDENRSAIVTMKKRFEDRRVTLTKLPRVRRMATSTTGASRTRRA
jgi:site-specific DNA-methyltransferase (adenine-specific)